MRSINNFFFQPGSFLIPLFFLSFFLLADCSIAVSVNNNNPEPAFTEPPKLIFWYNGNPGFPPQSEWKSGDSAASLYKEMQYGNMASRPGSKEYFARLKALGFDEIFLNGFSGPYNQDRPNPVYPDDLSAFSQTRNYKYYIPWAKQVGLEPSVQIMFFNNSLADDFSWFDDKVWLKIETFLRFAAKTAKMTGCKGLSLELEPYYKFEEIKPWDIKSWEKKGYSRTVFLEAVKKRSAQMATAIFTEFPDAQVHIYGLGVGADSFLKHRSPWSAKDFTGDDLGDIIAYFLGGFFEKLYPGRVYIDEAATYGVFEPKEIKRIYSLAKMKFIENTLSRWDLKHQMAGRVSIGLALLAHHRWNSLEWWNKIKRLDEAAMEKALTALLETAPHVWVYPGEVDWIYPELADALPVPKAMTLAGSPYASYSARMMALTDAFRQTVSAVKKSKESQYILSAPVDKNP